MGWQEDHDAWLAEVARLDAEYQAALDKYNADMAARAAAIAAWDAYDVATPLSRQKCIAWFLDSLRPMEPILFSPTWAGPVGYWNELSKWLNGPDEILPPLVLQPQDWIRVKLQKAALTTTDWDLHCLAAKDYEQLRINPPAPAPEPPDAPVPPTYPEEPQPPIVDPATHEATPTGFKIVSSGGVKVSSNPILDLWNILKPGEIVNLAPGDYRRADLKMVVQRPEGGLRVTFRSADPTNRARITRLPEVGSSDTLQLLHGVSDTVWENIVFQAASRAALKTVASKRADGSWWGTGHNHTFKGCDFVGDFNPTKPGPQPATTLWSAHFYMGGNFLFENCLFQGIYKEHAGPYGHNNDGDYTFRRCTFRWGQRTDGQWMSRYTEGPLAKGDIRYEDCLFEESGFEDGVGGSLLQNRGGQPNTTFYVIGCRFRLGCDPNLQLPWRDNIGGAFVVDAGDLAWGETDPATGKVIKDPNSPIGNALHPYGLKQTVIKGCDIEVGRVWRGLKGRRSNVRIVLSPWSIEDTHIWGGTNGIALEIEGTAGPGQFIGQNLVENGTIKYRGQPFATIDTLKAAQPALFS